MNRLDRRRNSWLASPCLRDIGLPLFPHHPHIYGRTRNNQSSRAEGDLLYQEVFRSQKLDRYGNLFLAAALACAWNDLDGTRHDFCASEYQRALAGTYNSSFNIAVTGSGNREKGETQTATIPVTFVVSSVTTTSPSLLLNPAILSYSGTAGGANPLAKTINLSNSTGGTLSWTLTESASWLALNITSGTTTTESDQISASVGISELSAGTYSTLISVTASGSGNSPKQNPVALTLSQPTTTGSADLGWTADAEPDLAGYKVYV